MDSGTIVSIISMIETRNHTIDILRGVTIILIVFGHITRTNWLNQYIWSFHIPVFFVLSGFLYTPDKFATFGAFIMRKFNGLIMPYFFFGVLTYLYWLFAESRLKGTDLSALEQLLGLFYGSRYKNFLDFNGPLWFIPCLFTMEIVFFFIEKLKRLLAIFIVCVVLFMFGVISKNLCPWLPFGICAASIGIIFYGVGYLLRPLKQKIEEGKIWVSAHKIQTIMGIAIFVGLQVLLTPYSKANLARLEIGNPFIYIGMACLGIFIYWLVSVLIGKSKLFEWIGKNTLVIFVLHGPVYRALLFILSYVTKIEVIEIRNSVVSCILVTVITVAVIIPFINIWNRWNGKCILTMNRINS